MAKWQLLFTPAAFFGIALHGHLQIGMLRPTLALTLNHTGIVLGEDRTVEID